MSENGRIDVYEVRATAVCMLNRPEEGADEKEKSAANCGESNWRIWGETRWFLNWRFGLGCGRMVLNMALQQKDFEQANCTVQSGGFACD